MVRNTAGSLSIGSGYYNKNRLCALHGRQWSSARLVVQDRGARGVGFCWEPISWLVDHHLPDMCSHIGGHLSAVSSLKALTPFTRVLP